MIPKNVIKIPCKVTVAISKVTIFISFWIKQKHTAVTNWIGESSMFLVFPKKKMLTFEIATVP